MQEMDLDELDQAVSKLMDQASKGKAKKAAPASAPVSKDEPTMPADDSAVAVAVASTPKAEPKKDTKDDTVVPVRRANLQVTPRKNGIAMDIVQAKPANLAPPSAKAARVAPTLQPSKDKPVEELKTEKPAATPVAVPEVKEPEPKSEPKEVSDDTLASLDMQVDAKPNNDLFNDPDHAAHKSVWPDPLEVHGFKDEPAKGEANMSDQAGGHEAGNDEDSKDHGTSMQHGEKVITPPSQEAKEEPKTDEPADADKKEDEQPADEPASTPFVAAKVEKRPLGAYADAADAKAEEKPAEEPKAEEAAAKVEPASIAVQTPKELSPEVVAVESAEPQFTPGAPKIEGDETDMNNLRQMSIPQQYQGKEAKANDKDRPIFDTKEYHPALKPSTVPARSSSKAGTVVTIILIVLMIAAAAVAYLSVVGTVDITRLL